MTPPIRPDWTTPDAATLREALVLAEHSAKLLQAAHTVCARIDEHQLGFDVMMSDSYAAVRERGLARSIAPVASVLPNGKIELYRTVHLDEAAQALVAIVHPHGSY